MENSGWFPYLFPEQTEALQWASVAGVSGQLLIPVSVLITVACSKSVHVCMTYYGKTPCMRPYGLVYKVNPPFAITISALQSAAHFL